MAQIIDGKRIAKEIKDKLKEEVSVLKERGTKICLAVIQVGQDAASSVYVNNKKKRVLMLELSRYRMNWMKIQQKRSLSS